MRRRRVALPERGAGRLVEPARPRSDPCGAPLRARADQVARVPAALTAVLGRWAGGEGDSLLGAVPVREARAVPGAAAGGPSGDGNAMSPVLQGTAIGVPFPGLRAFEAEDALLFYGREAHVAELLDRLGECHFVAVTGTSGSGKSDRKSTRLNSSHLGIS